MNHNKSSREITEILGFSISRRTVLNWLYRLGYTFKKTFFHPKRDENQREYFRKVRKVCRDDELVFVNESGIEDNACCEYCWDLVNKRCYEDVYFNTIV